MPTETIDQKGGVAFIQTPGTGSADTTVGRDATRPGTDAGSKPAPKRRITRRTLLIGALGAAAIAAAVFGSPWIRFVLSTVSTDDAFVNGHVTSVAPRVHGQVARVLVDDNNRVHKGDLLVELDKEPLRDAVAVKKAAVDTAGADLQVAKASVRGIEAQAWSRRSRAITPPTFRSWMSMARIRNKSPKRKSDKRIMPSGRTTESTSLRANTIATRARSVRARCGCTTSAVAMVCN